MEENNMHAFRIYYAILPSLTISNVVAPGYRHVTGENTPKAIAERNRVQQNYITNLNNKNKFYIRLEESVKRDGFINPIFIQAGYCVDIYKKYLPEEHQKDLTKVLCCDRNGGSRLYIAQKLNLDIPCIISDFVGRFSNSGFLELYNETDIINTFNVKPKKIIINAHGVHVSEPVHVHLDKKDR